ncbi:HpcH/HpaI aldolase/citrate lyase family protein [Caenimonas soli]|uniref:HpcH/HpaI aldolase/citrate lyase family protein n=1 Tax=Caenimonas soli TaxID=2735555 RepID=UPI0015531EDD|nr:CoA ester lyase [Caenimonas soli]NPC55003.1 CoA ester lyase [Caenimonas soli]
MTLVATHARSFLFLPADRLARLDKAMASGAHMVILDLEDAVASESKPGARAALLDRWSSLSAEDKRHLAIRINAVETQWYEADCELLRHLAATGLTTVMLPKAEAVTQLASVKQRATGLALLPLIESAKGLHAVDLIARAPGVARLVFGHLDFQVDLGIESGPDERELDAVRLALVVASRHASLNAPVDGVTVNLKDAARLASDTQRSRRFGFGGKLCIHPDQVASVNELLGASDHQIAWARRVLEAAHAQSAGAFQFEGAMVDAPVLARARAILNTSH